MKSIKLSFAALALAVSLPSLAQVGLRLGNPSFNGTGCPIGSVATALSPDDTQLSILFDQFVVEAGPAAGTNLARKNCSIAIPVTVPNGYSVSVVGVDYRGFVGLPRGRATATFTASYFFADARGVSFSKTYRGGENTNYVLENDLLLTAVTWSRCGAQTNLRISSSMMVNNPEMRQDALATVDSVDVSSGIVYQLQYRSCR
jgi:hypothetical protein